MKWQTLDSKCSAIITFSQNVDHLIEKFNSEVKIEEQKITC